jgi:probable biosynthetic protein (TIGR04098 family)
LELSLELGMPHLGRNNLSESALFKTIGHDRWSQLQTLGGLPTSMIFDDAGARLYATFFFLEVHLSPDNPLSAYGENEKLTLVSDLSHYEKVYLDGRHVINGCPERWIRSSNVFIYQERGPSKLSLSVPATMDFSQIRALDEQPDSLTLCRQARAAGCFWDAEPDDVALFEGKKEYVYKIDIDRDLNGAGLVYFANFISFLDVAEREVLSGLPDPVPADLLDLRSTYRRRVGYFGNAQSTDRLHIFVSARIRVLPGPNGSRLLDLGMDYRIRRSSDNKEILISSCRKVASLEPESEGEQWADRTLSSNRNK